MLRSLLHRLTAAPPPISGALFGAATAKAREPHFYQAGHVADTIDGRFRMLATILALVIVRLEQLGSDGAALSVALTEHFVAVMESEHRELGLGDPTLGRRVRKLVGALSHRVDLWRSAVAGEADWEPVARQSVYADDAACAGLAHTSAALRQFWSELAHAGADELGSGAIG